ncbi:MAG: hypothetical protein N2323_05380, partial [candidate division WOR-3 bacterium]|nr:hypothetical protein [candidate division WOR-3 bacterium]
YSLALYYEKPYTYLATDIGLSIIDVKDPYSPIEINYYESENYVRDVLINFPYAYLDSEEGLEIIKIGKKENILLSLSTFFYLFIFVLMIIYIIYRIPKIYKDWKEKIKE